MKTIVTGGSGLIGSHLTKRLIELGRDVIVVDDFSRGNELNFSDLGIKPEIKKIDLRDLEKLKTEFKGVESVFHLAARVGSLDWLHGTKMRDLAWFQDNCAIDANVFRACIENSVGRIVYPSSAAVYPIHEQEHAGAVFSEDDLDLAHVRTQTIDPDGGYGWAKLVGEVQLSWAADINISVARLFNVYGENFALDQTAPVIPSLIRRLLENPKGPFVVWGDGEQTRDFLYVSDCVDALIKLEDIATSPMNIVNLGAGSNVSIGDIAKLIVEISGFDAEIQFDVEKPVGPISRQPDISKANALLGWYPEVDFETGLRRVYSWLQKRLNEASRS